MQNPRGAARTFGAWIACALLVSSVSGVALPEPVPLPASQPASAPVTPPAHSAPGSPDWAFNHDYINTVNCLMPGTCSKATNECTFRRTMSRGYDIPETDPRYGVEARVKCKAGKCGVDGGPCFVLAYAFEDYATCAREGIGADERPHRASSPISS